MKTKTIICILILLILGHASCNDFLDTPPKSTQMADQYYTNEEEVQLAANGLYTWLRNRFNYVGYGEAPAFMLEYPAGYCYFYCRATIIDKCGPGEIGLLG
ncbi:MAG: hypothetical protein LUD46_12820 [Parabacteroides sp.]|nr:hypothetical protein [Parabacteroides sp.]